MRLVPSTPYKPLLPGVLLCGVLGGLAMLASRYPWFAARGVSALPLAIALGLLLGNLLPAVVPARLLATTHAGAQFARQRLLRLGIVLFGLRLSLQDIAAVGTAAVLIDAVVLASTFALAWWAGERLFGLARETAILIGAGSAICGAAAVMASEPVVKAQAAQLAVAVATVVVFGTLAMLFYPVLYQWNVAAGWLHVAPQDYGIYVGSTVHEVAQVVVAGAAAGPDAANAAVITKMVRVMMLAPFLLLLSWGLRRKHRNEQGIRGGMHIPWFAIVFLLVVALNSIAWPTRAWVPALLTLEEWLLATAMFALGLGTHVSAIRQAGVRPLALAALLAVWLVCGGLLINRVVGWGI